MKAKILMVVMLVGLSAVLYAQPTTVAAQKMAIQERRVGIDQMRNGFNRLNLTDAQKESFKQGMLALQKQLQPLRNELREAMAHQRTLSTVEKPDLGTINKNIEKIGALHIEMTKIRAKHRLEMRTQLTDEQRLKFDLFRGGRMPGNRPCMRSNGMM